MLDSGVNFEDVSCHLLDSGVNFQDVSTHLLNSGLRGQRPDKFIKSDGWGPGAEVTEVVRRLEDFSKDPSRGAGAIHSNSSASSKKMVPPKESLEPSFMMAPPIRKNGAPHYKERCPHNKNPWEVLRKTGAPH